MKTFFYITSLFFLGMFLLFGDFYTKAYVYHVLPYKLSVFENCFGVHFSINVTMNRGAAWGLFSQFQLPLEIIRIIVVLALIVFLIFFSKERKADIPLIFIIVGALGNIIDYFLYGFVVDFFHFNFWGYNFPVFNVADTLISLGVGLLFLMSLKRKIPQKSYES